MSKIRIRDFGPVKTGYQGNEGWIEIQKVTLFIGNQGTGKSSIAKLISTFTWIEKALTRGDYTAQEFTGSRRFKDIYCAYHRIENYFYNKEGLDKAEIEYEGESYSMQYKNGQFFVQEKKNSIYKLPQVMYVPAERSFISNVQDGNARKLRQIAEPVLELTTEFGLALKSLESPMELPINNAYLNYDKINDITYIEGDDYKIRLHESSSGFQSIVPLFVVTDYLAKSIRSQAKNATDMSSEDLQRFKDGVSTIWSDSSLSEEQRRAALSVLSARFNKTAFINIVEEPEQNLFPSSQRSMLNNLLFYNNLSQGNKLVMTTHSPYIINYLTLAIKAKMILDNPKITEELKEKVNGIVPIGSAVNGSDIVIYEIAANGKISLLENYKGLPSDENYLNNLLSEANYLFSDLKEIERQCR